MRRSHLKLDVPGVVVGGRRREDRQDLAVDVRERTVRLLVQPGQRLRERNLVLVLEERGQVLTIRTAVRGLQNGPVRELVLQIQIILLQHRVQRMVECLRAERRAKRIGGREATEVRADWQCLDRRIDRERWRHCRGCRDVGQRDQWDVRRIVGKLRDLLVLILETVEDTIAATRHKLGRDLI